MFTIKSRMLILLIYSLSCFTFFPVKIAIAGAISLPKPLYKGTVSVEEALKARRTTRSFSSRPLKLKQLSQILWGAYGVTARKYGSLLKTAPSAGALYPLDIYCVVGKGSVDNLAPGVYHFNPEDHSASLLREGDQRAEVARHSLHQVWMARAPLMLIVTGEYERSTTKYGPRGVTYTHIEAGCVGQNIFLQAEAMGLKVGIVGAFNNSKITAITGLPSSHEPMLIMPVGFPSY